MESRGLLLYDIFPQKQVYFEICALKVPLNGPEFYIGY